MSGKDITQLRLLSASAGVPQPSLITPSSPAGTQSKLDVKAGTETKPGVSKVDATSQTTKTTTTTNKQISKVNNNDTNNNTTTAKPKA